MARRIGAVFCTFVSPPHCCSLIETTGVESAVEFSSEAACTFDSNVVTEEVTVSPDAHAVDCRRRPAPLPLAAPGGGGDGQSVPGGSVIDAAAVCVPIVAPSSGVPSESHGPAFWTLIASASDESLEAASPTSKPSLTTLAIVPVVFTSELLNAADSARMAAASGGGEAGGSIGGGGGTAGGHGGGGLGALPGGYGGGLGGGGEGGGSGGGAGGDVGGGGAGGGPGDGTCGGKGGSVGGGGKGGGGGGKAAVPAVSASELERPSEPTAPSIAVADSESSNPLPTELPTKFCTVLAAVFRVFDDSSDGAATMLLI
eukprot:2954939-Prymnesium_polylepis.2